MATTPTLRHAGQLSGVDIYVVEGGWTLPTEHASLNLENVWAAIEDARSKGRTPRPLVVDASQLDDLKHELALHHGTADQIDPPPCDPKGG